MKNIIMLISFLFFGVSSKAQQYYQMYYNLEMQSQVTANHTIRMASEQAHRNSYEKQKNLYNEAKEKLTAVVVIKDNIYGYLKNVNSGLKQAKQVQYLFEDYQRLLKNMEKMLELTANKPQYAILITRFYERVILHAIEAYGGVNDIVMKEDADYLMDSYDRQYILNKLHKEVRVMNGWVLHINNYLSKAEKKPYLRHIKIFNNWYVKDKSIIESIIRKSDIIIE